MGRAMADLIPATGPEPELVGLVPGKDLGLVDRSVRYLQEPCSAEPAVFHRPPEHPEPEPDDGSRACPIPSGQTKDPPPPHSISRSEGGRRRLSEFHEGVPSRCRGEGSGEDGRPEDGPWPGEGVKLLLIVFGAPTAADAEALLKATEEKLPGATLARE